MASFSFNLGSIGALGVGLSKLVLARKAPDQLYLIHSLSSATATAGTAWGRRIWLPDASLPHSLHGKVCEVSIGGNLVGRAPFGLKVWKNDHEVQYDATGLAYLWHFFLFGDVTVTGDARQLSLGETYPWVTALGTKVMITGYEILDDIVGP